MYCKSCGALMRDGAQFCPKCGAATNEAPQAIAQPQPAPVDMADMPSTGLATVLVVIGFVCGVIWGIIGFTKLKPMKAAIAAGDVETAKKCFGTIRTVTIIGIVLNVLVFMGAMAQR